MSKSTLDPEDWSSLRKLGHDMLDDMFDLLVSLRERPVWQQAPSSVQRRFESQLPRSPTATEDLHREFMEYIAPYGCGNLHPGFMGWVQGGGNPVGMLAEMLAAGLNVNAGGRNQIPVRIEREITGWMRELFSFPATASGLFVTGTSMANLLAVLIARVKTIGIQVREDGLQTSQHHYVAYTSAAAHGCVAQAMDLAGCGKLALRRIPVDDRQQMRMDVLRQSILEDTGSGLKPFFVAATAGTVDTGAIDPLAEVGKLCKEFDLWFHIDGAFGAMGMLAPQLAPKLEGIQNADSIAFDFHKWPQVPYDAGYLLVRDQDDQLATFASPASYLRRETRGLAGDSPWPCDLGPDLSRGFRALKTWFTFKSYGTEQLGQVIWNTCQLAQALEQRILAHPALELRSPANLNIVCFRFIGESAGLSDAQLDALNAEIAIEVQESGIAAPSTTVLNDRLVLRAAIVNHRTNIVDIDNLLAVVCRRGTDILSRTER